MFTFFSRLPTHKEDRTSISFTFNENKFIVSSKDIDNFAFTESKTNKKTAYNIPLNKSYIGYDEKGIIPFNIDIRKRLFENYSSCRIFELYSEEENAFLVINLG